MIDSWDYMVRGHGRDTYPMQSSRTSHAGILTVIWGKMETRLLDVVGIVKSKDYTVQDY